MTAGCGVNNPQAVRILVEESEQAIRNLAELGVSFDRRPDGRFQRSLEGNHSARRILHVNGDATGKGIMTALIARCAGRDNISLLENTFAVDLVTREGTCSGVIAEKAGRLLCLSSPAVVMATGGIGQLFPVTTNSKVLTGDGIAAASRAGAALDSLEFIQFHPTALYSPVKAERAFLISEAVRGEGALLRNREETGSCPAMTRVWSLPRATSWPGPSSTRWRKHPAPAYTSISPGKNARFWNGGSQ